MNGALIIDKSAGMTSHDVVAQIRKLYNTKAVGHAGTLDPIATGILVCLLGEGTKLSQYVMGEDKSYHVGIKFGVRTDSGDVSGKPIMEKQPPVLTRQLLTEKIDFLKGEITLSVPKYSAIKVDGKKLYEYARENEDVEVPTKAMVIKDARLLEFGPGQAVVEIDCEKGTYVRSWVEKLGEIMGCGATVEKLRRTKSGPFTLDQALTLQDLEKLTVEERGALLIDLPDVLADWPALKIVGRDQVLLKNGQIPKAVFSQVLASRVTGQGIRFLTEKGELLAIALKDPGKGLRLARVFNCG